VRSEAIAAVRFKAVVPQFTVPDVVRTAQYYQDVLGFQIAGYWDGEQASLSTEPPPIFAIVSRDNVQLFLSRADEPQVERVQAASANDAYFNVDGVDALAAELQRNGADILDGPEDRVYRQRELIVRDCNGFVLTFAQATGDAA
jgi:predicted enzyme related to lactoylglutathione lyase